VTLKRKWLNLAQQKATGSFLAVNENRSKTAINAASREKVNGLSAGGTVQYP
jgi:hypothetical protein